MARPIHEAPTLKCDPVRGYFYCRWGGRTFTFGSDQKAAHQKFLSPESDHPGALHRWQAWAAAKAAISVGRGGAEPVPLIVHLSQDFLATYEHRPETQRYYRKHLGRWMGFVGELRADVINEAWMEALRSDMIAHKFAPKTIAHDLKAVKTFWRWACRHHPRVPRLELSGIRVPAQDEPTPHPISRERLRSMIDKARFASPPDGLLGECLVLSYYALLRPSELVRVLRGDGHFESVVYPDLRPWDRADPNRAPEVRVEPRGLYVMASKVQHRTGAPRYVVLSEQALQSLEYVQAAAARRRELRKAGKRAALWERLDTYSSAVRVATGSPPSVVRDTAASDLHSLGAEWGVIDALLGHVQPGAGRSYIRTAWHTLRDHASRIRL